MARIRMRGRAIEKYGATRAVLTWMAETLGSKQQATGGDFWAEKPAIARKGTRRGVLPPDLFGSGVQKVQRPAKGEPR